MKVAYVPVCVFFPHFIQNFWTDGTCTAVRHVRQKLQYTLMCFKPFSSTTHQKSILSYL